MAAGALELKAALVHDVLATSNHLTHRPNRRRGEGTTFGHEVLDNVIDNFAQFGVKTHRVVAVDARDQIGTSTNVGMPQRFGRQGLITKAP
jgi:hypothetical protein